MAIKSDLLKDTIQHIDIKANNTVKLVESMEKMAESTNSPQKGIIHTELLFCNTLWRERGGNAVWHQHPHWQASGCPAPRPGARCGRRQTNPGRRRPQRSA